MGGLWNGFSLNFFNSAMFIYFGRVFNRVFENAFEYTGVKNKMSFKDDRSVTQTKSFMKKETYHKLFFFGYVNLFNAFFYPLERLKMKMMLDMTDIYNTKFK